MYSATLTNMVMIRDAQTGKILVQERLRDAWKGWNLPGGHVEPGESFVDSAIREVFEETGLQIRDLESCGVIDWCHTEKKERYLVFLYRTEHFEGTLLQNAAEGRVFWVDPEQILNREFSNDLHLILPMFLDGRYSELFGPYNDGGNAPYVFK